MIKQELPAFPFHESLEKDIIRLSKEIHEKKKTGEFKNLSKRELVKQSLSSFTAPSQQKTPAAPSPTSPLPTYLQGTNIQPEIKLKVERLLDLTWHQGLKKGIREAQKQPPFIEDAYHDALVDKLLPELKRRGILK